MIDIMKLIEKIVKRNLRRYLNEMDVANRRESTNFEDRRGEPLYKHARDLIKSELLALAICYEAQPVLFELKQLGLLEDFLSEKFSKTKYKVDNDVIDLLTTVKVPEDSDPKKAYWDYLECYYNKYKKISTYGPFICIYKRLETTNLMGVKPWFAYLGRVIHNVTDATIKRLRREKRYEERGNAAAQGVRTNFSPHLTR